MALDWSTAVPDWAERIQDGRSLVPELPLDQARAERALRIFKNLRVPDVEGWPTHGEVCRQWVFDLVAAIFGAFDAETSLRIIREYFVLIPKKNGKTSIAAAILVVALILNERPNASAVLIAPTQKIAQMAYKQARDIIKISQTPSGTALEGLFWPRDHEKEIVYLSEAIPSSLKILAADTNVVTGSKATYILIDETHEFSLKPKADQVMIELEGGLSHPQNKGFLLQITTQSKAPPAGVFKAALERAREVRDGIRQAPMLALLYELPEKLLRNEGWKRPETWGMVNPHLGQSFSEQFLIDALAKAEQDGIAALALFASQHLNVEIGQSLSGTSWSGARFWQACGDSTLTVDRLIAESEVATIGVDWGGADDLASLAVIGRRKSDQKWLVWSHSWARPSVFEERKSIASQLEDFRKAGNLTVVDTGEEQAAAATDIIEQVVDSGLLPKEAGIGLDVAGVALLVDEMQARGIMPPLFTSVGQGWKLQAAISTIPLKLESKRLIHAAQPIMAWAVGNAKQELKNSNYLITKQTAGAAKIDPLMALFNAAMLMFLNPVPAPRRNLDDFLANPIVEMRRAGK